jgi:hypothetical protein
VPVLLIAVKGMAKDSFVVYAIRGLTWSTSIGGKGYIYLAATRCGTAEMWMDWFRRVCLPTMRESRLFHQYRVSPSCVCLWLQLDLTA